MIDFNKSRDHFENSYAKNNPSMLKHFFGTTDLTSLWIADMDFEIAEPISTELQRIVNRGVYSYEFAPKVVFQSISDWYKKYHGLDLKATNFLQVPSVLTGIAVLLRNFSKEGDGILIQTPVYHQFTTLIEAAHREIITNPLINTNGYYTMNYDDLEAKFKSGKVRMMILCNPHNPVGRVWKKDELERVLKLADQYEVRVISDEIHADIVYSGYSFCSFMSLSSQRHIALIGSTAKTFGMHSISNGFLYVPAEENFNSVKSEVSGMFLDHGTTFTTFATIAAYNHGKPWLNNLLTYLQETLSWINEYLKSELPRVRLCPTEGTYQIWLDFSDYGLSAEELKNKIIHEAKLGLAHGDWFDESGKHDQFMRINIASPLSKIQTAFYQLKKAFN